MKLRPHHLRRSALTLALIGGALLWPQHYSWSAAGYPTPETQIIGDETGLEPQYDLTVTVPQQAVRGESFEVRLSFAHSDPYFATATATLLASNGIVLGDTEIELTPENAWQVTPRDIGTVGLTIRVTTRYSTQANASAPQVTYSDTLTRRVTAVAGASTGTTPAEQASTSTTSTAWSWWVVITLVGVLSAALVSWYAWRRRKH